MILRHLQKTGHKPIVLLGGGTTKVGDPTGKDASRKMLNDDDIASNINGIRQARLASPRSLLLCSAGSAPKPST